MGRKVLDLVGQKFGKLTVVEFSHMDKGHSCFKCKCDCGNTVTVRSQNLRNGNTKSCGCLYGQHLITHGESHSKLYATWSNMYKRCYYASNNRYQWYGARGITVCDEWKDDFMAFRAWALDNGYKEGLTIDRIDNDKGYSPDNCRWITKKQQASNKSNNHRITYMGRTQTVSQWAEEIGIKPHTLLKRLNTPGWSLKDALTKPIQDSSKALEYNGEVHTRAEWERITGLGEALRSRLRMGWDLKTAIETPINPNLQKPKGLPVQYKDDCLPLKELCIKYNKNYHTVQTRLQRGWSLEDAMDKPISDGTHTRRKKKAVAD